MRRTATSALGQHRPSDPEIRALLIERAQEDDAGVRRAATSALGQHVASDPEIRALLIERAEDDNAGVRRAAIAAWFMQFGNRTSGVLLSRDLDGFAPGLDPRQSIDGERVAMAARQLGVDEDHVRSIYERLADDLPLMLQWKNPSKEGAGSASGSGERMGPRPDS